MVKWLRASTRAYKYFFVNYLVVSVCLVLLCSSNWYVISPSSCSSTSVTLNNVTYTAQSINNIYIKLLEGVCKQDSSGSYKDCLEWEADNKWEALDEQNRLVSSFTTDFAYDAEFVWPKALAIASLALAVSLLMLIYLMCAIYFGRVRWTIQVASAVVQIILVILMWVHLGLGLSTDTILPVSWRTYYLGCNIYTGPGVGWWAGLIATVICLFSSVLMLFPYMMGNSWVSGRLKDDSRIVATSEDDREGSGDDLYNDVNLILGESGQFSDISLRRTSSGQDRLL